MKSPGKSTKDQYIAKSAIITQGGISAYKERCILDSKALSWALISTETCRLQVYYTYISSEQKISADQFNHLS